MRKFSEIERNSIKQMFRMPVKTVSFFVMIAAMGFLISLSLSLYAKTAANIKSYKMLFKTTGTVTQLPSRVLRNVKWDAERKDYLITQEKDYGNPVPLSVLNFEGADYIVPPEKRSYYASYSPEYNIAYNHTFNYVNNPLDAPVVEFSPVEDCVPSEAVRIHVTKVLFGWQTYAPSILWFCDHDNENPEMLYKDKTYIAHLWVNRYAHGDWVDAEVPDNKRNITTEFEPLALKLNHYDEDGNSLIENDFEFKKYYEVTDYFYDTKIGKYYLNYAEGIGLRFNTFPVTGTNSIDLLMPFSNNSVYIAEGRDISEEAYENGLKECLVSVNFAKRNGLEIGDSVNTNLLFTSDNLTAGENYIRFEKESGSGLFEYSLLMDDGKLPEVFETAAYTIVGLYDSTGYGYGDPKYQLGSDEMIVPLKSIKNKDKNILDFGPMNEYTTSFRIPNGSIDSFMEKWDKLGITNLELKFYDMGYTKLEKGMKNMQFMAVIFGIVGIVLGAVLLVFYSRMFIGGQKVRITIERCMGITVKNCRRSLLTGALLVLVIGSLAGCILGIVFSGTISVYDMGKEIYDTTYTAGQIQDAEAVAVISSGFVTTFLTGLLCEVLIVLSGYAILHRDITALLKHEPLYLLDGISGE